MKADSSVGKHHRLFFWKAWGAVVQLTFSHSSHSNVCKRFAKEEDLSYWLQFRSGFSISVALHMKSLLFPVLQVISCPASPAGILPAAAPPMLQDVSVVTAVLHCRVPSYPYQWELDSSMPLHVCHV